MNEEALTFLKRLTQTKSLDAVLGETQGPGLKKVLGPTNLVLMGIGAIIGTGIYSTLGTAVAGDALRPGAGPAIILSFILTAVVCGFTALCYAEFASMVPVAGSAYTYAYATLGELVAWVIGWDLILEYGIGNVAVAISWAGYAKSLLHGFGADLPSWLTIDYRTAIQKEPGILAAAPHIFGVPIVVNILAVAIVAFVTIVLIWGMKESARFNAVMVLIKLVVLGLFVVVGWSYVHKENWHPVAPNGFHGIGAGAAVIFFAYIGFDAVSTSAEECKKPGRDLPIGILGSLVLCTVFYVIIAGVFTGLVPFPVIQGMSGDERAEALTFAMSHASMPAWTVRIVGFGSIAAQTAVLLVFQLGQARMLFAMSRDGFLPKSFAKIHPKYKTPHVATIITGVVVAVASAFANIDEMVDLTNIGTLFAFILVCVGIIILRFRDPKRPRPFRVPFGPVLIPGLGLCSCLFLIVYLPPASWLRFVIWLAVGLVVYAAYGYRHSRLRSG